MSARGTPEEIRGRAEERFRKAEEKSIVETKARAEHEAGIVSRDANTARLKGLRLAKEQTDRDAASAAPPKKASVKKRAISAKTE
jgi:hypothetical protein